MTSYNPVVKNETELRQCKVNGKNAFFHKWSEYRMTDGKMESHVTVGIVEYVEDGKVGECFPEEIQFLDTKGKAMGYCWNDKETDDYNTALIIGKTKHDAENMVKNLGLIGFKDILTRGEENLINLDGIRVAKVYIYEDCGFHAKCVADTIVANEIDGEVVVIKRKMESEGE